MTVEVISGRKDSWYENMIGETFHTLGLSRDGQVYIFSSFLFMYVEDVKISNTNKETNFTIINNETKQFYIH